VAFSGVPQRHAGEGRRLAKPDAVRIPIGWVDAFTFPLRVDFGGVPQRHDEEGRRLAKPGAAGASEMEAWRSGGFSAENQVDRH
jgi:hypothetical protein